MSEIDSRSVKHMSVLTLVLDVPTPETRPEEYDPENSLKRHMSVLTLTLDTPVPESRPSIWDYNDLINKPSFNNVTLSGDLTLNDFYPNGIIFDCGTSKGV